MSKHLLPSGRITTSFNVTLARLLDGVRLTKPSGTRGPTSKTSRSKPRGGKSFGRCSSRTRVTSSSRPTSPKRSSVSSSWFANIRRLIGKYLTWNPNYDCHKWVASLIYKVEESKVTKEQRSVAKNGVYGGNYHMMPKRASQVYKLSLDLATWVLNSYRSALPEVPQWWRSVEKGAE